MTGGAWQTGVGRIQCELGLLVVREQQVASLPSLLLMANRTGSPHLSGMRVGVTVFALMRQTGKTRLRQFCALLWRAVAFGTLKGTVFSPQRIPRVLPMRIRQPPAFPALRGMARIAWLFELAPMNVLVTVGAMRADIVQDKSRLPALLKLALVAFHAGNFRMPALKPETAVAVMRKQELGQSPALHLVALEALPSPKVSMRIGMAIQTR